MDKNELIDRLDAIANNSYVEYPEVTMVLFALCGALHANHERLLCDKVAEFSQAEVIRLTARNN